jgi:hypothetical protein
MRALGGTVSFPLRLVKVELTAQLALILCALLFGIMFVLFTAVSRGSVSLKVQDLMAVPILSLVAYLQELGPVAIIFAPIYAVLEAHKRATVTTAMLAGAAPGLAVLALAFTPAAAGIQIFPPVYSALYTAVAVSVAAATHLFRSGREKNFVAA